MLNIYNQQTQSSYGHLFGNHEVGVGTLENSSSSEFISFELGAFALHHGVLGVPLEIFRVLIH